MGLIERRIRQKEEVRTSIIQAAWRIVQAESWQALSIRKIADAIEYSVPVIYHHFENKEAILFEFTKEGFSLLVKKLRQARDKHTDASEQLEAMANAYWQFAFKNKAYYQLMFGLGIPACEMANQVAEMKQFGDLVISVMGKAITTGKNPQADRLLKFHTYWSILHGLVSIQMIGKHTISDPLNEMVLQDAIGGFIKALKE